ncbi:glycosyl transferase [Paenibacillus sambharensis]|uniref:Glycosyl transferase n=1 Tax=Paenibacillus sambharensis TaxID=1803190 RepID=A0A2W1L701_9BACL|nr:glycosyltransferase [Paenibacillus sambharensis]PZD94733.1 glycosyl transferase [Paenibacillus sambharensis]
MKSRVLIITDRNRKIPFSSIISFYDLQMVPLEEAARYDISDYIMVIVDLCSEQGTEEAIHYIRQQVPHIGILVIQDFVKPFNRDLYQNVQGYGQFRVMAWKPALTDKLANLVQTIIHPEYPVIQSRVAIVLPLYNEESRFDNVLNFLGKLQMLIETSFVNVSVYFINDGSRDATQPLVEKFKKAYLQRTTYISHINFFSSLALEHNTRKAGTYIESLTSIDADMFVFVDADDSFHIDDIAKFLNIIKAGYYDIVVGTKDMTTENRPVSRRVMSFFKRLLTRPLLPYGVYDSQTGLKAFNHAAAQNILPHLNVSSGLAIDLEMLYLAKKLRFRVLQLPVICTDRDGSHVRIVHDSLQFMKTLLKLRFHHKSL